MSNDYVLLISTPRPTKLMKGPGGLPPIGTSGPLDESDGDVKKVLAFFKPKIAPGPGGNDGYLQTFDAAAVDGGNGAGGDGGNGAPLKVKFGYQRLSYWNFRACPPIQDGMEKRFPPVMRYEACVSFAHLEAAREFLNGLIEPGVTRKLLLERVFVYVQLVAVTDLA